MSRTHFACENAQYTSSRSTATTEEQWQPASVSVSDIGDNQRELTTLYIYDGVAHEKTGWLTVWPAIDGPPLVFRPIKEGWDLQCDEVSESRLLRNRI